MTFGDPFQDSGAVCALQSSKFMSASLSLRLLQGEVRVLTRTATVCSRPWIILVIIKQHLVQIGRIDGHTETVAKSWSSTSFTPTGGKLRRITVFFAGVAPFASPPPCPPEDFG